MSESKEQHQQETPTSGIDRRSLIVGGSVVAAGILAARQFGKWARTEAPVFVGRGQQYGSHLPRTIADGLKSVGCGEKLFAGKRVLLKPNLVEPTRAAPHMTTNPAMVVATAEVLQRFGAEVIVGEGPGHVRDTEIVLDASGVGEALEDARIPFADLNYDDTVWVPNQGKESPLAGFYFPRAVMDADIVISMPKMKTHHWVGVTASMKNLYGVIPGIRYGWPKNVLHFGGIPQTVYDINASLPPVLAVVDGIDCMEGDGPIMGSLKRMGVVVVGASAPAVDATVCRLMDVKPHDVEYLHLAANRLGPIEESQIEQRGEDWKPLAKTFEILDRPHLRRFHTSRGALTS